MNKASAWMSFRWLQLGVVLVLLGGAWALSTQSTAQVAEADQLIQGHPGSEENRAGSFDTLFGSMKDMQEQMNRMFDSSFLQVPNIRGLTDSPFSSIDADVRDEGERYVVGVDLPGLQKEEIELRLDGRTLRISALRSAEVVDKSENYLRRERRFGQISRSIELPGPVVENKIVARYLNGVLTIEAPKDNSAGLASGRIPIQ